jgi:hypothetical protein
MGFCEFCWAWQHGLFRINNSKRASVIEDKTMRDRMAVSFPNLKAPREVLRKQDIYTLIAEESIG